MTCEVCSGPLPEYTGRGRPRVVCSTRCHNWRQTHPGERPRWLSARLCAHCGEPVTSPDIRVRYCEIRCQRLASSGSAVKTSRVCRYCDGSFEVTNGMQVYCSRECRVAYNRRFTTASALRRTARRWKPADSERFTVLDIADRDGWVCALCLGPIDLNIRGDRRYQVTVDHVLPLSKGGRHTFDNVQLAHWTCNAAKRDSTDVAHMSVPSNGKRVIVRCPPSPRTRRAELAPTSRPDRSGS